MHGQAKTENHTQKTPATYTQGIEFVSHISGRLSLFLDPSEPESLSSSLDAKGEKMSCSDDIFLLNEARGKETQQINTSDPVFNTPSSTQALEINNCRSKK